MNIEVIEFRTTGDVDTLQEKLDKFFRTRVNIDCEWEVIPLVLKGEKDESKCLTGYSIEDCFEECEDICDDCLNSCCPGDTDGRPEDMKFKKEVVEEPKTTTFEKSLEEFFKKNKEGIDYLTVLENIFKQNSK